MPSHSPTFLALETDSAWVVIVVVSIVSFIGAIGLRRVINRTGGVASGILLAMPLLLPMVAAVLFPHPLLPEIAVLRPAGEALLDHSDHLLNLLLLSTGHQRVVTPYALTSSAGSWILIIGLSISSFILLRRIVGAILVRRLISRCRPLTVEGAGATAMVGVATAQLFPQLVLGASAGLASRKTGDLFNGNSSTNPSTYYLAGPAVNCQTSPDRTAGGGGSRWIRTNAKRSPAA